MNESTMKESILDIAATNSDGLLTFNEARVIATMHRFSIYDIMIDLGNDFRDPEKFAWWLGY